MSQKWCSKNLHARSLWEAEKCDAFHWSSFGLRQFWPTFMSHSFDQEGWVCSEKTNAAHASGGDLSGVSVALCRAGQRSATTLTSQNCKRCSHTSTRHVPTSLPLRCQPASESHGAWGCKARWQLCGEKLEIVDTLLCCALAYRISGGEWKATDCWSWVYHRATNQALRRGGTRPGRLSAAGAA